MGKWLLSPPAAFMIVLVTLWIASRLVSGLAMRIKRRADGSGEPYACGENDYDPMAQPDYSNVFPFAFFFTLAHVATLIMTTVPTETLDTFAMAAIYVAGAVLGLYILFRD